MAFDIILPQQGWSMEEAAFVEWLKREGDTVNAGEPLFAVETEKAVQEIEASDSGILRLLPGGPAQGETVKVGQVIGRLVQPGEHAPVEGAAGAPPPGPLPVAAPPAAPAAPRPVQAHPVPRPAEQRPVSPRAARRALREGVDLRAVQGTGRHGRIREQDVEAAARSGVAAAPASPVPPAPAVPGREAPISTLRRTIADRMHRSKTTTAPVTLTTRADASALVRLRDGLKTPGTGPVPSYSDILMKLVASALIEHPALNSRWEDSRILQPDGIHIGLAVDTEAGLVVPVVRDVPALSLRQIAARTRDLVERARQRRLSPEEMGGGTFTITNLGAAGVDVFTPIINHPECAVLGMGRIAAEPVAVDGQVAVRDRMWLSLTFDHRIVDGAPAARFLDAVRKRMEAPGGGIPE